jgi:putative membrane protein
MIAPRSYLWTQAARVVGLFCLIAATTVAAPLKDWDRAFILQATKFVGGQVTISDIAIGRASNPQVKELAKAILSDYSTAQAILAGIAASKGVKTPPRDPQIKWTKKTPRDFDRDYVAQMISDQKEFLPIIAKEAKDGRDGNVVTFARQYLPLLQANLDRARALEKNLK